MSVDFRDDELRTVEQINTFVQGVFNDRHDYLQRCVKRSLDKSPLEHNREDFEDMVQQVYDDLYSFKRPLVKMTLANGSTISRYAQRNEHIRIFAQRAVWRLCNYMIQNTPTEDVDAAYHKVHMVDPEDTLIEVYDAMGTFF